MDFREEKLSKFVQAITQYAEEQRDKIIREAEEYKSERLKKAEREVLTDAYKLIQSETEAIRKQNVREMSLRDLASRKEVLVRRRQITDEIFERVKEKLKSYTLSPEYGQYMEGLLGRMAPLLPDDGTVYYISRGDERLKERLSKLCPPNARIELSDNIEIGGILGVNAKSGYIIDNTLSSKLNAQSSWFAASSGLNIDKTT